MPPRRRSVVSDAGSRDDQLDSAGSDGEYTAKRSATGGGRGARGRGRGRSSVRARARGRGAAAAARAAARRIDDDEEDEEDENSESDFENQASRSPRPVSPELGVPTAPALALTPPPTAAAVRSSSLSLLSSPSSSPAAPEQQDPPPPHDVEPSSIQREAAILSSLNGNHASLLPTPADVGFGSPTSSSAGTVKHAVALEDDLTADSLSELESELTDNENNLPFSSQDVSTNSTPAPSAENGYSPAPKRRGRPPGSRNKQHKPPAPRSARTAVAARPSLVSAASGSGTTSGGTRSRGGETGGRSRATRANVTLPAGYIEGVTSSRWPRKRGERDDDDSLPGTTTPGESRASSVATSLGGGFEEDDEEKKALLTPKAADLKGKSRAVEEDEEDELMSVVEAEVIEEEKAAAVSMSRETSLDGPPTPSKARNGPGRPRGKGKRGGKKGVVERVAPEPIERAKRRKLSVDEEALQRAAAREVARFNFLAQLEDEAKAVVDRTHPLLAFTYQRLTEEKAEKLEQLRLYQEERESEYARLAEARLRHIWGAWADRKDSLRTDLYFETSANLKDLIFEERSLPFFRDHPLFTNTHDLPPTPFYRGPVRDPAFVPRSIIHAGHYVEPPPQNSAVEHNSWKLSSSEIEADLALFYDIDDEPYAPPMLPATPAPPVNAYPYSNPYYPPPPALGSYLPPPPPHLASVPPHMSSYPPPPIHSGFYPPPPQPVAAPPAPAQHPQHPPHPLHPQHPHHHPHQHHQPPPSQPAPRPQTQAAPPPAKPQAPVAPPPRPVIDQRIPAPATMPPPPSMKPVVKPPAAAPAKAAPTPAPSTAAKQSSQNGHYPPPPVPLPPRQGGLPLPHSHAHPLSQFHHHHHPAPPVTSTPSPAAPKPSIPSIASAGYGSSPFGARSPYTSSTSSLAHPASGGTHSTGHGHSQPRTQLHHHQPTRSPNPAATSPPAPQHLGGAGSPAFSPAQSLRPSPSLSAPKLPSLTHRATPSAQTSMPSASPPVQPSSTSSAPHFPSLFGGDRSNSGLRPPLGLGGLLGGGSGLGGMSAPLGFGPATGLPLPSWLKPLPKPNVGVAPPSGVAGAGDAAGVKKEALSPLPQVQTAPGARPYWT